MKKFTLISLLMLIVSTMANAQLMDKFFFKIPTDKADGWTLQDAGRMTLTPGKDYLDVKLTNNGGRMINRFWNEDAWSKVDVASLPNNTYKFSKDMKMTVNATRTDMEFVLLPVNACTETDSRVSSHNYHWFNNEGEDYFFRYRVTASTAEAVDIVINENPTARGDWPTPTEESETATLNVGVKYSFEVEINVAEKTATYTISDEEGNVVKTGVHNYVCEENRAGIWVMSPNSANSVIQLSNMGLSYKAEGPFAVEPSIDLVAAIGEQRAYYVDFSEGHTLHWIQLGDAEDAFGNSFADGQEYTVGYWDANDTRELDQNPEEYFGKKNIYCTKSGDLKVWTSLDENEANVSEEIITPVVCETVTMPVPEAKITNVEEGFGKEYTITVDNSNTLLKPVVTIKVIVKDASGAEIAQKDILSGEKVVFTEAGSVEMYSFDGTHPFEWYAPSEKVTITNNAEYAVAEEKNYIMTYDEINAGLSGWDIVELVDNAGKSHWDRIMSTEKRGYKEDGSAEVYVEDNAASYVWVKEGHGIFADTDCGTDNAKWNVLCPNDVYTCALPLIPSEENAALYKVFNDHYAWCMMPFEGLVYYDVNTKVDGDCAVRSNYLNMHLDPKYVSDDASKPNFFIVNKTGGYNRPDKGDCTSTEVIVAGETFKLYRYDTAISSVKVMTYKGFNPGTGISSVNDSKVAAPAVKKIVTKNGVLIVNGDKVFSATGARMK